MENKNLTKIALMQGLNEQEISLILNCLQAKIKKYEKGETIFQEGEKIEEIGIIFSGTVTVQRNDYWGNRSIVALLGEMDVFGETFACLNPSLGCAGHRGGIKRNLVFTGKSCPDNLFFFLSVSQSADSESSGDLCEKKLPDERQGRYPFSKNNQRKAADLFVQTGHSFGKTAV